MMTEHKDTFEVVLSEELPAFSEAFSCKVPELRSFSVELWGRNIADDAELVMTLTDADTDKIYFEKESSVRAVLDARTGGGPSSGWKNRFRILREKI